MRYGYGYSYPRRQVRQAEDDFPLRELSHWRLSADWGVSKAGDVLTEWASRGPLTPGFIVKGTGLTVAPEGDIDFPGAADSFLYEGTPVGNAESHTLFGLIQLDSAGAEGDVVIGKFVTTTGERSWQIGQDAADNGRMAYYASANGTSATKVVFAPAEPAGTWAYFVARKTGAEADFWWNGFADLDNAVPATLRDNSFPICIGGRAGGPSTNVAEPFNGRIRDIGYFDAALSDGEVEDLLDWLSTRM